MKGCLVAADTFSEALAVLFKLKSVLFRVLLLLFEVVPKENIDDVPRLWVEACVTGCPKRLIPAMSNEKCKLYNATVEFFSSNHPTNKEYFIITQTIDIHYRNKCMHSCNE